MKLSLRLPPRRLGVATVAAVALATGGALTPAAHAQTSFTFRQGVSPSAGFDMGGATIRQDTPTVNAGTATTLIVGANANPAGPLRGLIEIDLSAIETQFGANPTISSVQLETFTNTIQFGLTTPPSTTVLLSVLGDGSGDFDETTATWNNAPGLPGGVIGTTLGSFVANGTADNTPSAINSPGSLAGQIVYSNNAAFQTAVTDALARPDNTLRLIFSLQTETPFTQTKLLRFGADDAAATTQRPLLTVVASSAVAVPEPGTLPLLATGLLTFIGGGAVIGGRRRRTGPVRNYPAA